MKAIRILKAQSPWEIVQMPKPIPAAGQVLIRVHCCGLCGTDLHVHHGFFPVLYPCIPGHEPVGEVVEVGPGVTKLHVGDRVGVFWHQSGCGRCSFCQSGKELYCNQLPCQTDTWIGLGGGMAEYTLAWESGCAIIPQSLSYRHAAPLFCAGYTVASGFHNAEPKPGETVAVFGIGGLGHLAIQYAKAKGCKVFAITEHEEKKKLAKECGADDVFIMGEKGIKEIQEAGGIDILLHTGNSSEAITKLLDVVNPEGRVVIMGVSPKPFQASPLQLVTKQLKIIGSMQNKRADLYDILQLAAVGKVVPKIEVYKFQEINDVIKRLEEGKVRFRAVILFE